MCPAIYSTPAPTSRQGSVVPDRSISTRRCAGLVWHSGRFASAKSYEPDRSDESYEPDESYESCESGQ